jgi:hypothetical protein
VVNLCPVQGYSISRADHEFQVKDQSESDKEDKGKQEIKSYSH